MDKERLRELFGEEGDVSSDMLRMFGDVYLDYQDVSKNDIPNEINKSDVYNIGEVLKRAVESSKVINCFTNQIIILRYFHDFVSDLNLVTHSEWYAVMKHIGDCDNKQCHQLYNMAILDTTVSPEILEKLYENTIKSWGI